jgi:hypothetical protein
LAAELNVAEFRAAAQRRVLAAEELGCDFNALFKVAPGFPGGIELGADEAVACLSHEARVT